MHLRKSKQGKYLAMFVLKRYSPRSGLAPRLSPSSKTALSPDMIAFCSQQFAQKLVIPEATASNVAQAVVLLMRSSRVAVRNVDAPLPSTETRAARATFAATTISLSTAVMKCVENASVKPAVELASPNRVLRMKMTTFLPIPVTVTTATTVTVMVMVMVNQVP